MALLPQGLLWLSDSLTEVVLINYLVIVLFSAYAK